MAMFFSQFRFSVVALLTAVCYILMGSDVWGGNRDVVGHNKKNSLQEQSFQNSAIRYLMDGEDLYVSSCMDYSHDLICRFRKCMYNELFTFYRIGVVRSHGSMRPVAPDTIMDTVINATSSDNIGPWGISGCGWVGGNHSWLEGGSVHTAKTLEWGVYADGVKVCDAGEGVADSLIVEVKNEIYDPRYGIYEEDNSILAVPMCIENVRYTLCGNSMHVQAVYHFVCKEPVAVSRYYGMQSMFVGETHVLAPIAKSPSWMAMSGKNYQIRKSENPDFNLFTERRDSDYFQTAYLLPTGLGGHSFVTDDSPIFIYASYGKGYHVLTDGHTFINGDKASWEGIYTWFVRPLSDDSELFCYEGRIDSGRAIYINCLSAVDRIISISGVGRKTKVKVLYDHGNVTVTAVKGGLSLKSSGPASAIISVER